MAGSRSLTWESGRLLGRLVRPTLQIGGRSVSTYHVCGAAGFALAAGLTATLAYRQGLSLPLLGLLILAAVGVLFGLTLATKLVTGEERIVNYHHQITVAVVTLLLAAAAGASPLPYLDLMTLGVGLFVACGRVGCFHAGCCHGAPRRFGVRYPAELGAQLQVPAPYLGMPLFPTQLVEAAAVGTAVTAGFLLVARAAQPGLATVLYATFYAIVRLVVETQRGDVSRSQRAGRSEAQWTSVLVLVFLLVSGEMGWLPTFAGQAVLAVFAIVTILVLRPALRGRDPDPGDVLGAAAFLSRAPAPGRLHLGELPSGLRLSNSRTRDAGSEVEVYGLSHRSRRLAPREARLWAGLVAQLRNTGRPQALGSARGVHRFVARRSQAGPAPGPGEPHAL